MSEEQRPETGFQKLGKMLDKRWKEFAKTPTAIPIIVLIACGVFYLSVVYLGIICFSNMFAPLVMLGLLWWGGVKRVRKLLVIGAVATLVFGAILAAVLVDNIQHTKAVDATSADGITAVGTESPLYGGKTTVFYYNLTVTLTNDSQSIDGAYVNIFKLDVNNGKVFNYSMKQVHSDSNTVFDSTTNTNVTTRHYNFSYNTTLSTPINQFNYTIQINGQWIYAGDRETEGSLYFVQGPIFTNSWAVAMPVIPYAVQYVFIYVFGPYAIILGMIWWTRRARRMRRQQMEKWEAERTKLDEAKPKDVSKVPSLSSAMGKGTEDTFVCSECGADVPADATVCPKCGEKFE
jgi:ribosomal protein L40E